MNNPDHRAEAPRLASVTCPLPAPDDDAPLTRLLRTGQEAAWIRGGDGMVGLGTVARFRCRGPERFARARSWWSRSVREARTADRDAEVLPRTGTIPVVPAGRTPALESAVPAAPAAPVAFAAFAFDDESPVDSTVRVPELILTQVDGHAWLTWQVDLDAPEHAERAAAGWRPDPDQALERLDELLAETGAAAGSGADTFSGADTDSGAGALGAGESAEARELREGALTRSAYLSAVADGVAAIEAGDLTKLVLARDVVVQAQDLDVVEVLRSLAARYDDCWTYAVDGLIGSTPEMLIKVQSGQARARVLAGTLDRAGAPRGSDGTAYATRMLFEDEKQRHEHQLAIDSLTERLAPLATSLDVHQEPFVLELPNVWHLASDVTAQLTRAGDGVAGTATALDLAEALHPTAAVCGTPREPAAALIRRLEKHERGLDRGLYAGPVGWFDAAGDGEFGIALRGAVVEDEHTVRLYAGCGIVAASDPEQELAETTAKMRPMLQALGLHD